MNRRNQKSKLFFRKRIFFPLKVKEQNGIGEKNLKPKN